MSALSRPALTAAVVALVLTCAGAAPAVAEVAAPSVAAHSSADGQYSVGVGIGDITGQAAEVGMLGYASLSQTTAGIHSRQWARAFVVEQGAQRRVAFVNTELDFVSQAVHQEVLRRLAARYGDRYNAANLVLTANHTHSGPGGFSHYLLYNVTTLGHEAATFEAIVAGIVRSVAAADADLAPGTVKIATGTLSGAQVNRSLEAFRRNPAAEQARFPDAIDRRMTVLRFEQAGRPIGMINFFATHGTSMTNTNRLISSDNKGYAAYRIEHDVHHVDWAQRGDFVAAFAQTSAGDMSPNLRNGGATGPTDDEFANTRIIGELQADKAAELFDAATETLSGPLDVRQRYVDFSQVRIDGRYTPDGRAQRTCPGALGQGFTAGAEDGPGPDIVDEGELASNPLLRVAGAVVTPITAEIRACHAPKPIFLGTGSQNPPWTPQVMPVQVIRIGQLALSTAPGEFTIVAGQRVMDTVGAELGGLVRHQILAGYANAYAGYVTTPEEYDVQHYEGAATHFGRYTLSAYQQELAGLAAALRDGRPTPSAVRPLSLVDQQVSLRPGIVFDAPPIGRRFGDVLTQPAVSYPAGGTVRVDFVTGHPGNNLRNEGTFVEVQRLDGDSWVTVATDADFSTVYHWQRGFGAESTAGITWAVPPDATAGTYRIVHHGDAKSLFGRVSPFSGTSRTFAVAAAR